jgi:FMN phosphatase YigB (HAD superfamily)
MFYSRSAHIIIVYFRILHRIKTEMPWLVHDVCAVRREALNALATPAGEQAAVSAAMDVFIRERTLSIKGNLFPDALPCLQMLNSTAPIGGTSAAVSSAGDDCPAVKRYRVGVMSNGYIDFPLLEQHFPEFTSLLDFYLQAADVGAQKPSVVPFIAVTHHSAKCRVVPPQLSHSSSAWTEVGGDLNSVTAHHNTGSILYVGDSYSKDVLGARSVGMKAVWLVRPTLPGTVVGGPSAALHDAYQSKPETINEIKLQSLEPTGFIGYLKLLHNSRGTIPTER